MDSFLEQLKVFDEGIRELNRKVNFRYQPKRLKRIFNGLIYVCESSIQKIDDNDENQDVSILDTLYVQEILNCFSNVELTSKFSRKSFKKAICILYILSTEKENIKRKKRRTNLASKKKRLNNIFI